MQENMFANNLLPERPSYLTLRLPLLGCGARAGANIMNDPCLAGMARRPGQRSALPPVVTIMRDIIKARATVSLSPEKGNLVLWITWLCMGHSEDE
jgi:hypothetical protein